MNLIQGIGKIFKTLFGLGGAGGTQTAQNAQKESPFPSTPSQKGNCPGGNCQMA